MKMKFALLADWHLLLLEADVEWYKNAFESDPIFEKFIERSKLNPDTSFFKNPKDGLRQVLHNKVVIEIEGLGRLHSR